MIASPPEALRECCAAPEQVRCASLSAEVLKLNAESPDPRAIQYAAAWLNRGAVIAIPTDTLYALAADPVNLRAVEEIFRVKGRPESRALPILINSLNHALILARELPDNFYRLAEACWPGPLTIVPITAAPPVAIRAVPPLTVTVTVMGWLVPTTLVADAGVIVMLASTVVTEADALAWMSLVNPCGW